MRHLRQSRNFRLQDPPEKSPSAPASPERDGREEVIMQWRTCPSFLLASYPPPPAFQERTHPPGIGRALLGRRRPGAPKPRKAPALCFQNGSLAALGPGKTPAMPEAGPHPLPEPDRFARLPPGCGRLPGLPDSAHAASLPFPQILALRHACRPGSPRQSGPGDPPPAADPRPPRAGPRGIRAEIVETPQIRRLLEPEATHRGAAAEVSPLKAETGEILDRLLPAT